MNGFRISLIEIEHALRSHASVKQAAVILYETGNKKEIIAFFTTKEKKLNEHKLSVFLSEKLPYFMLPHKFILIQNIPLTINKKIDYKNLARQYKNYIDNTAVDILDEKNPIDHLLKRLITDMTGHENIAYSHNLFSLGLQSLHLVSLCNAINKTLDVNLKLPELFLYKNIKQLSEYLHKLAIKK